VHLELEALQGLGGVFRAEHPEAAAFGLGLVHRRVGVALEGGGVEAVAGVEGDADAAGDEQGAPGHREGLRQGPQRLRHHPLRPAAEGQGLFDLVFLDADKPSTAEYLRWALELTRPGSLIVADNVVRAGVVLEGSSRDPSASTSRWPPSPA